MNFNEKCLEIYRRSRAETVAVFDTKHDLVCLERFSERFDLMLNDFPRGLVGVYNSKCTLKMIQDDIL